MWSREKSQGERKWDMTLGVWGVCGGVSPPALRVGDGPTSGISVDVAGFDRGSEASHPSM